MTTLALPFRPAAVLFDMDGLMIDSEPRHLACWQQTAIKHGLHFSESLLHGMVGLHRKLLRVYLQQHFPQLDTNQLDAMFQHTAMSYHAEIQRGIPSKIGVIPLLQWLIEQQIPRGVGTSSMRDEAELNLQKTGLREYFEVVVTGSDIIYPKPAPDVYCQVAEKLGVAAQHCVVLEDSEAGVRAALAAGMTPIQVPDLNPPSAALRELGHRIVPSLTEAHVLLRDALTIS